MSIKSLGGVFGRNPTFNDVTVEGDLSIDGTLSVGGNVLSGLDFEGAWDATSGAPSATPSTGQFWIVSVAGTTNLSGITNWGIGDWALYDGSAWQRIEGGADGNFKELTSSSTTILNGTTIPASKTLVVTTDIGSTVEAYDATILKSADIGSTVQGYDATILTSSDIGSTVQGYDATILTSSDIGSTVEAYDATILKSADIGSTVQGYDATILTSSDIGSTVQGYDAGTLTSADIGSTVQAYDADTAKLDANQTWTGTQAFDGAVVINEAGADVDFRIEGNTNSNLFVVNAGTDRIGVNNSNPGAQFEVRATHTETDVTTADSNSTLAVSNNGTGNGVYNSLKFAGNQQDMYIMSFNHSAQASRRLGFFVGSVAGDAVADERLSILGGGDVKVNNGNLVIGTSGKGIDFSATAGTGTSELLDDYEEGEWTGVFSDGTNNATMNASYTKGRYVKVGSQVTVSCWLINTAIGSMSGDVRITGLPFTSANANEYAAGGGVAYAASLAITAGHNVSAYVAKNTDYILLRSWDATAGTTALQASELSDGGQVAFSLTYFAA